MTPSTEPEIAAVPPGRESGARSTLPPPAGLPADHPRLLRSALAAGRLPLGALRLTLLQALDADLDRRGRPPAERRDHRDRVGRFLADHADRRRIPGPAEARRWAREMVRRGRTDAAEAEALLRSVRLLYAAVPGRTREGRPGADDGPPGGPPAASRGPLTGRRRRGRAARQ